LFVHSSADRHLVAFISWQLRIITRVNMGVQVFVSLL
jgi:hypothetical protein